MDGSSEGIVPAASFPTSISPIDICEAPGIRIATTWDVVPLGYHQPANLSDLKPISDRESRPRSTSWCVNSAKALYLVIKRIDAKERNAPLEDSEREPGLSHFLVGPP